jgi:hypothetical protein
VKQSVSASDIEALGVSPAKSYGHVAGTPARFFGAGIIKLPKLDEEAPFKVYIRKTASGGYEFKARKGFVDGKEASGAVGNTWNRITPQTQSVILECKISSDMSITEAKVIADKVKEKDFRVEISGKNQTYARIIIAQFDIELGQITIIQNLRANVYTAIKCWEGVPARFIFPERFQPG